eukprot:57398_1
MICKMNEKNLVEFLLSGNTNISSKVIKIFYNNILKECDTYVDEQRLSILGISYNTFLSIWSHIVQIHLSDDHTMIFFKENISECRQSNCQSVQRRRGNNKFEEKYDENNNNDFNAHFKEKTFYDKYFQSMYDSIHCIVNHSTSSALKKNKNTMIDNDTYEYEEKNEVQVQRPRYRDRERVASDDDYSDNDEGNNFDTINTQNIEMTEITNNNNETLLPPPLLKNKLDTNYFHRYTTDSALYGFGIDHNHLILSPHSKNKCFHEELLNSKYMSEELWNKNLFKAYNRLNFMLKSKDKKVIISKQYNEYYNINRGQIIGIQHLLAIIIYTGFTDLCTDYRSTFRRTEKDVNDDSVRQRHCHFYFLSRFLYEAVEYFGDVMKQNKVVYHGLNKKFLFKQFLTHFNAPMSTTVSFSVATNFQSGSGVILVLKNGNKDIKNDITSEFAPNQPRYTDAAWLSCYYNEQEYLFYGDSVIFEINKIFHEDIAKNTLKQLNLLQQIIEQKDIEWHTVIKRAQQLAIKLKTTREMISEFMKYNNSTDEIDYLYEYFKYDKTDKMFID